MFSTRLEQLRAQAKKTQNEFAQFLGVPRNTYTNWIRRVNKPNYVALPAIAHKCGVPVDWITGHEHFGRRVMKFREARGWTQAQFVKKFNAAHDADLTETDLVNIENEYSRHQEEFMEAIIDFLGVSKEEFLGADVPAESQKILAPKTHVPAGACPQCAVLIQTIATLTRTNEQLTRANERLTEELRGKVGAPVSTARADEVSASSSTQRRPRKAV